MDGVTGSSVQGSMIGTMTAGATLVAARVGNGLFLDGTTGEVDYGNRHTECCQNPDVCDQGITFAMWIKTDDSDRRVVLSSGGTYKRAKGKLNKRNIM